MLLYFAYFPEALYSHVCIDCSVRVFDCFIGVSQPCLHQMVGPNTRPGLFIDICETNSKTLRAGNFNTHCTCA